jgi:hypothetical protein
MPSAEQWRAKLRVPWILTETTARAETTYGGELEVAAFVPVPHHPIGARLTARFERRVDKGVQDIAQDAGVPNEEVVTRLETGTDAYADLLEQTLQGIRHKASEEHRQAMARVAAQAWSADDAAVDRATLVVGTIASLQPVHVRALVAASKLNDQAGQRPVALEGPSSPPSPVTVDAIAETASIEADTVPGIVCQLVARGLLWEGSVTSYNGLRMDDYLLTQLGADVLNALGTDG